MHDFLVDDSTMLEQHLRLIRKVAINMHKLTGYDSEDLYSEGCLLYLLKMDRYRQEDPAKLSTFIWHVVWNGLINYIKHQTKVSYVSLPDTVLDEVVSFIGFRHTKHRIMEHFVCNAY